MSFQTTLLVFCLVVPNFAVTAGATQEEKSRLGTTDNIQYRMSPVRGTQIQFPRLTAYRDITTMSRVNAQIDELTKEFGCPQSQGKDDSYKVLSRVEYAAQDIFSIYVSESYYCGGPYPTNDANMSLTFDLRTGKKVEFDGLFKNYNGNKDQILRIIFAKQLARTERLRVANKTNTGDSSCEEDPSLFTSENLRDSEYAYNFSKNGLVVQPQWPHVVEACAERVAIPYREIKEFAAPNGILARVIP